METGKEIHAYIYHKKDRTGEYYCLNVVTEKGKVVKRDPNKFDGALIALKHFEKHHLPQGAKIKIESVHAITQ
jgi:hypothetical protein